MTTKEMDFPPHIQYTVGLLTGNERRIPRHCPMAPTSTQSWGQKLQGIQGAVVHAAYILYSILESSTPWDKQLFRSQIAWIIWQSLWRKRPEYGTRCQPFSTLPLELGLDLSPKVTCHPAATMLRCVSDSLRCKDPLRATLRTRHVAASECAHGHVPC